jgi:hypothetical protein
MSKFKMGITKEEWTILKRKPSTREAISIAEQLAAQADFQLGQVLVARNPRVKEGADWVTDNDGNPQKWVVVFKNEANMVFAKKIIGGGRLGTGIDVLCAMAKEYYIFEEDPDKVDAILLDDENAYDPAAKKRAIDKVKRAVQTYNRTIRLRFDDPDVARAYFTTLAAKTPIWYSNYSGIVSYAFDSFNAASDQVLMKKSANVTETFGIYQFTAKYYEFYASRPKTLKEELELAPV